MMRFNILILILMALLAVCMFVVGKNSTDQTKEIRRLRWRVDNLETVVNKDVKIKIAPKEKADKQLSANRI